MARPRSRSRRPLIEFVLAEADRFGISMQILEKQAGLAKGTIGNWGRDKYEPKLGNIQAAGNVLGYELCWRPRYETSQNGVEPHGRVDFLSLSCLAQLYRAREHLQESDRTLSVLEAALTVANGVTPCTPSTQSKSKPPLLGQGQEASSARSAGYNHQGG